MITEYDLTHEVLPDIRRAILCVTVEGGDDPTTIARRTQDALFSLLALVDDLSHEVLRLREEVHYHR